MTSNKQPIPKCVIDKIFLEQKDDYLFKCPKCKLEYTLFFEIMEYDDSVGTAYDDEAATIETEGLAGATGPALVVLDDDNAYDYYDYNNKPTTRSDIKIPKYMQDSETTKVIDYKEIIEEE